MNSFLSEYLNIREALFLFTKVSFFCFSASYSLLRPSCDMFTPILLILVYMFCTFSHLTANETHPRVQRRTPCLHEVSKQAGQQLGRTNSFGATQRSPGLCTQCYARGTVVTTFFFCSTSVELESPLSLPPYRWQELRSRGVLPLRVLTWQE